MQGFKYKIVLHKIIVLCSGSVTKQINPIFRVTGLFFFFFSQQPELQKNTASEKICYLPFSENRSNTCLKQ